MANKPNIIFIVSDDLGYADLGCYGGRQAQFGPVSPHIDALAAGGAELAHDLDSSAMNKLPAKKIVNNSANS